jgi:chemotaxis protein MotB
MGDQNPPIVIKRIKKVSGGGHHGGSWKIAYADFVTAMMAFFLLMWLIGSTTKGDLEGIAEFFSTPLKVALAGGSGSGDSSSIIQGGGQDLTRSAGQVQKAETPSRRQTINLQAAKAELARREKEKLESLKRRFEQAIQDDPKLTQFQNQIRLEITTEGLQITVVDEQNRAMFDTGRAALKDYTRDIMHAIGGLLNGVDNAISLAGHTDAKQYAGGERGYSNWELSSDRANASRRELVAGGMNEMKILRVVGLGSSLPLDVAEPLNPMNRRISLVVLNEKTERQIRGMPDEPMTEVENEAEAADALGVGDQSPTLEQPAELGTVPAPGAPAEQGAPPADVAPAVPAPDSTPAPSAPRERLAVPGTRQNPA